MSQNNDSSSNMSSSDKHISDLLTRYKKMRDWEPNFEQYTYKDKPSYIQKKSLKPFAVSIIASRNSGKSTLLRHLYEDHLEGKFDIVLIFSNTLSNDGYDYINDGLKYHVFNGEVLKNLFKEQDEIKAKCGMFPNVLVILDDCIGNDIKNDPDLQNIFLMGRHKAVSVVFIVQSVTLIKTTFRQNITKLFILSLKGENRKYCIHNFLENLISEDDIDQKITITKFLQGLLKYTFEVKYRGLVVDFEKEGDFYDCCRMYKADI